MFIVIHVKWFLDIVSSLFQNLNIKLSQFPFFVSMYDILMDLHQHFLLLGASIAAQQVEFEIG